MAVQPRAVQDALAGFAGDIGVVLQHDFVLRQGAGFIGAEDVHRAKVLDGVEVFNDHFLFRELHRPARQRGGDNHRQHFRRQANGHGERKQGRFPPVAFGVAVDQQHDWRHHHHKADQQHADAANPFLEGVWLALLLADAPGKLTKPGVAPGGGDNRLRGAADHRGAHKAQGVALERVHLLRVAAARHLFNGQGFAGQGSLRHKEIARLNDA